MKTLLVVAALALAPFAALTAAPPATADSTPPSAQSEVAHGGWTCAGSYSSYGAACRKARYLKDCGYCTCIKYDSYRDCYTVYYR
jgi:hypothetical protein